MIAVYAPDAVDEDGCIREGATPYIVYPPSGEVARLRTDEVGPFEPTLDGVPVTRVTYGALEGLPPAEDGVQYVVSLPCVAACVAAGRYDVLVPHQQVRARRPDGTPGATVGCRSFGTPATT